MATLVIGVDSGYQWVTPTTDADIVKVGQQYVAYETGVDPAKRLALPTLTDINAALVVAQGGLESARREEDRRAVAATEFHRALTEATPLLQEAFEQLKWKHRDNLSRLQEYGLKTKTGASGKVLVTKPRTEPEWAAFLQAFVTKEESLPADQRLLAGTLLPLTGLATIALDNEAKRSTAKSARKLAVETRSTTAGPLLDLLQLAFGLLVVTRFDRRVTNALEPWGFVIKATASKTAESTPEPKPVEPGV